jgi:hypothetical protein
MTRYARLYGMRFAALLALPVFIIFACARIDTVWSGVRHPAKHCARHS